MFGKVLITTALGLMFIVSTDSVSAQLLTFDGDTTHTGNVVVGTTTYSFSLPRSSLESAQKRLQDIYYYIRNTDSATTLTEVSETVQSTTFLTVSDVTFGGRENVLNSDAIGIIDDASTKVCNFTKDLSLGTTDTEVRTLQQFLNQFPETRVAQVGVGAQGNETDYFGRLTFNAVYSFQAKYADDILAPLNLTQPTGYWGAATREYANTLVDCEFGN